MKHSEMLHNEMERLNGENTDLKKALKRAIDVDIHNCTELLEKIKELKSVIEIAGEVANGSFDLAGESGVVVDSDSFFALKDALRSLKTASNGD